MEGAEWSGLASGLGYLNYTAPSRVEFLTIRSAMDPRGGAVGILPWIVRKIEREREKGEGYVLIRRERKGEGGFFPEREIGFSDLFCLQCLLDGVRGKEGVVVAVVSGEEFREGGLV